MKKYDYQGKIIKVSKLNSGGIPQSLHNIFFFKIGIIREKFLAADTLANLTNDHSDGYPHTANTGLAAHNGRVLGYSVKIFIKHKINITLKSAKSKYWRLVILLVPKISLVSYAVAISVWGKNTKILRDGLAVCGNGLRPYSRSKGNNSPSQRHFIRDINQSASRYVYGFRNSHKENIA